MTLDLWTWWQGALALAAIALGHAWFLHRPLAVSGLFTWFVNLRAQREVARLDAQVEADPAGFEAALMAATMKAATASGQPAFAVAVPDAADAGCLAGPMEVSDDAPAPARAAAARPTAGMHLTFIAAVIAGGALAQWLRGASPLQMELGATFTGFFGAGKGALAALLVGGMLVGAGTRMAGGCTSGHGLSGVARFQPASLAATVAFFGTGVAVSFLLARVLA